MFAPIVYLLCTVSSIMCAWVLYRSYNGAKSALLLWCSLSFAILAVGNILLFIDLVVTGESLDLSLIRGIVSVAGLAVLLYGLIWETV
jgi:hypothetical protein